MKIWMDIMRDLEHLMDDHEALFDGWQAGGVDGLVIGPLVFNSPKLLPGTRSVPAEGPPAFTYDPNPLVYKRFGVEPPPVPVKLQRQRALLERTLQAAKDRGFSVWIFQAQSGAGPGGTGHVFGDEQTRAATCARIIDTLEHYPMVDGAIMDGPEWGYEIAPHHMNHRSYIFHDLPESIAPRCAALGYDYPALVAAVERLRKLMHELDPRRIRLHSGGGVLGGFHLLGADPDLMAWLRFRVETVSAYFGAVREMVVDGVERPVKVGVGPRSAAFAPLCGYDFVQLAERVDLLLPKHYFWQRGFDGLVGTLLRYVETLCEWNKDLDDGDALRVVEALFGLSLPGVKDRADLERALTPEFWDLIARKETERVLAAVGDAERVVPWVDAGRWPHDGDPMSAQDLGRMLAAAQDAGLARFLYHHHANLTAGEWVVMSEMCGVRWNERESGYRPPDQVVL